MRNKIILFIVLAFMMAGCAHEYNQVYKTTDITYKYEYAKECYASGKYVRASTLLLDLITLFKNTANAEESLYLLGMSQYMSRDYESAAQTF